mgnify:CR=1
MSNLSNVSNELKIVEICGVIMHGIRAHALSPLTADGRRKSLYTTK